MKMRTSMEISARNCSPCEYIADVFHCHRRQIVSIDLWSDIFDRLRNIQQWIPVCHPLLTIQSQFHEQFLNEN